jgi:hypothetical protein
MLDQLIQQWNLSHLSFTSLKFKALQIIQHR